MRDIGTDLSNTVYLVIESNENRQVSLVEQQKRIEKQKILQKNFVNNTEIKKMGSQLFGHILHSEMKKSQAVICLIILNFQNIFFWVKLYIFQNSHIILYFPMEYWKYLAALCTICRIARSDYIFNGGFEIPKLGYDEWMNENLTGWAGHNYEVWNPAWYEFEGQVVDLQAYFGENGYIEQTVFIPSPAKCNLSFIQWAQFSNPLSQIMEVYWNGKIQSTQIPNSSAHTLSSLTVYAIAGNNTVKFKEIGDEWVDGAGMVLQRVDLTCEFILEQPQPAEQPETAPESSQLASSAAVRRKAKFVTSAAFSVPANQMPGLRFFYLLAEDLWLYNYDKYEYEGTIYTIFNTTSAIESWKFLVLDSEMHWGKANGSMKLSDYKPYTRNKFVRIQSESSVLIKAAFPFFIYTVPENILIGLTLYFLFIIIRNYKVSQYVRKYYFMKTVLLQTLVEGNVIYFVYVCFGHFSTSFSFQFGDKISMAFTLVFFLFITVSVFVFYSLAGEFLQQRAGYFIYNYYRCNEGLFVITVKNLVRNFLRGSIFYFLHEFYAWQLCLLSIVEVLEIVIAITLESTKKIFILKAFYCFELLLNFLFILLNFSFYLAYASDTIYLNRAMKQMALVFQQIVIYLMISVTILTVIFDLLPMDWLKRKTKGSRRQDQQKMVTKLSQNKMQEQTLKEVQEVNPISIDLQENIFSCQDKQLLSEYSSNEIQISKRIQIFYELTQIKSKKLDRVHNKHITGQEIKGQKKQKNLKKQAGYFNSTNQQIFTTSIAFIGMNPQNTHR